MADSRKCPDCNTELAEIRLLDRAHSNAHEKLAYAAADSERSFFLRRYKIAGQIRGLMCGSCGRIFLYGEPENGPDARAGGTP